MTTIYLIRHAEAEGNLFRRIHGQFQSRVTPNGLKQIDALRRRFADVPVDACYASDLLRTCVTARAIYEPKDLPLNREPAFREIGLGVWEDTPFGWLYTFDGERMHTFNHDPAHWSVENSETYAQYTTRFLTRLTELARQHDGQTIAIFSHGAVMRGNLLALFPGEEVGHSDNTAVSLLHYENGVFTKEYLGDNSHLLEENLSTLGKQVWWKADFRKRDQNLWFRPGSTPLDGLEPPRNCKMLFTAMLGREPAGILCLAQDGETGWLEYMGLLPRFRGRSMAIQMLGQAVYALRPMGCTRLCFQLPADGTLDRFCTRYGYEVRDGICTLDLLLSM